MATSSNLTSSSRRDFLATAVAVGAAGTLAGCASTRQAAMPEPPAANAGQVRPFQAQVQDQAIDDLRRRIAATRWPDPETVHDRSQGVRLAKIQPLVRHWGTDYDCRRLEARLNALPQFITNIDGLDIHFIHVRSRHPDALPLLITHGWPGSVVELLKVIGPLTDPTAHGGRAGDAFDLVLPSIPGFGFSAKPRAAGWGPDRIAHAWAELMRRAGYKRYVAQGGDWGSVVTHVMARAASPGLVGIHVNMPICVPAEIVKALKCGDPPPSGLSAGEHAAYLALAQLVDRGSGYSIMMKTRPQTVGYSLQDSPAGLAAWIYDKFADWTYSGGEPERALARDEMLDDISLYWFTDTATSSARIYWENQYNIQSADSLKTADIRLPVAVTVFPGEVYRAPKSWAARAYRKLIYFNAVDRGGHFAAWEQPELFSAELRLAFASLR